ncbi:hypothetical protein VHEMI02139 [[Torrubiella] hemipterigena]|uniref:Peptidase S53 domain-containing protein n=1 Tax=[Torrubiella] hemipterigena TaxID=1531966 RepID=A0A0A1T702_9HYPO|nr:hypothetical protein VHEMI02139 [[Torrubiella] hemipterigena]
MFYPIIYPQNVEVYQRDTSNGKLYASFLDAVEGLFCEGDDPAIDGKPGSHACGAFKPANVITISYAVVEWAFSPAILQRQCNEWMKLDLQGTSVFHASGDVGVVGPVFVSCSGSNKSIFNPIATATCPYITTVDSTEMQKDTSETGKEVVCKTRYSPGGGFSNVFPRPDYQDAAVSAYLANHAGNLTSYNITETAVPVDSSGGRYNRAGRGYPDISALGSHSYVILKGEEKHYGGTSMSAPIAAAVFNRINEECLAAGKKTVGFVNPALYKNPSMFHDITLGGMRKVRPAACGGASFDATPGRDSVTDLGTPNYLEMLKYYNYNYLKVAKL